MASETVTNNNSRSNAPKLTTRQVVLIGVMAAIVFVSNYISFTIPLIVGDPTRIHVANIFCLLAGMLLGPVGGGLAAGIGSALYDLTFPAYVASAPFTFAFKFLMAFVAGKIANSGGRAANDHKFNLIGSIVGQVLYIVLYLGKKFISGILVGNAVQTVLVACTTSLVTSSINAVISIAVVVLIAPAFKKAMALAQRAS